MTRYPEIDILRGIALLAMAYYHFVYDLVLFELVLLPFWEGFWWWLPRCVAATFILLAGLSLALRASRGGGYRPFLRRGLMLLGAAAGVTAVSYISFGPQGFVFFGVLHLIAFATLVSRPLLQKPVLAAALGFLVLVGGLALGGQRYPGLALAWLGLRPHDYSPADYLPVLPWYAWFLFGISLAAVVFPKGRRRFPPPRLLTDPLPARTLAWLGRHTLVIYLAHLPALYVIVWVLSHIN